MGANDRSRRRRQRLTPATFLVCATLTGLLFGTLGTIPPSAAAGAIRTTTISDPTPDVKKGVPAWEDIVSASVSAGSSGNFSFNITDASAIPSAPPLESPYKLLVWWFCLQVTSNFSVGGWPTSSSNGSGNQDPCQYFIALWWDGTNFAAGVANRTPMLTGGSPAITTIPFQLNSATVSWSVARVLIGSPTAFSFFVNTEGRSNPDVRIISPTDVLVTGSQKGYVGLDPDPSVGGSFAFAQWP